MTPLEIFFLMLAIPALIIIIGFHRLTREHLYRVDETQTQLIMMCVFCGRGKRYNKRLFEE